MDSTRTLGRGRIALPAAAPPARSARLPTGPVLGWGSFAGAAPPRLPGVADLPHTLLTSSGRASLYHALRQSRLAPGSAVLVPTYHCPTMVAPIVCAGLVPVFFAIGTDGLPLLDTIAPAQADGAGAMIVAHYFGLPKSLKAVRAWCDERAIALIEDCAHSLYGQAGEKQVGGWGVYATASISKFLPAPELGLLGSAERPIAAGALRSPPLRAQVKGIVDVLESASAFDRPAGLSTLLRGLFRIKNGLRDAEPEPPPAAQVDDMMRICDMARIGDAPLLLSRWLFHALPAARVVSRRQANYDLYAELLAGATGSRFVADARGPDTAPYVFPLWVEQGDRVYQALRAQGLPVFRWDRIWPGTPERRDDEGPRWSRHVLQLLCHQDLSAVEIRRVAAEVRRLLHD